jgi:hypothetical protein
MATEAFEFSEEQSNVLKRLARLMKYAAVLFIFIGVIIGIFCGFTIAHDIFRGSVYLFLTILTVVFGVWTNGISYSFRQIVETAGQDIDILMEAFKTMKRFYMLQFIWLIIITLLFLAVLILNTFSLIIF